MKRGFLLLACFVSILGLCAVAASAQQSENPPTEVSDAMDMRDVIALLRQQQEELTAQRTLLEQQNRQIVTLTKELDALRKLPPVEGPDHNSVIAAAPRTTSPKVASPTTDVQPPTAGESGSLAVATTPVSSATEAVEQKATGAAVSEAQADDPTRDSLKDFPGAWRLPGTNAAMAIGGFVKTDVVYNFDPLQIKDRFIVGSIPVGVSDTTGEVAQGSITADQSRLNFDFRQPSDFGMMRAFIEGDFAGSNETFRLRHAFGQWSRMLAGKTWSTFVDPEASPEEIDFEGLNARINVRQSQIRIMPRLGEEYEFQFAVEDPNPEVQNGQGVTRTPDIVLAGRFQPHEQLHMKVAILLRQIRAQNEFGNVESQYARGISLSGRFNTPMLDKRDNLLFQLNMGNGIGRYVNDLSSIGNYDGIFGPTANQLQLFNIVAGYVSWQHWWGFRDLRSNFTFGAVELDNPGFVESDAYKGTLRFSSNLIWSPIPKIDIGGEYLWGRRENQDGETGDATQLQFAVRYRF